MNKETGGPAFPVIAAAGAPEDYPGMTLRDYFAAKAMQGLFSAFMSDGERVEQGDHNDIACAAYMMADAMLKARES